MVTDRQVVLCSVPPSATSLVYLFRVCCVLCCALIFRSQSWMCMSSGWGLVVSLCAVLLVCVVCCVVC